jgi:hypothetical protein
MTTFHPHVNIAELLSRRKRLDGMFKVNDQNLSDQEAREMLTNWPYPNFCGCGSPGPDGCCLGHEKTKEAIAHE